MMPSNEGGWERSRLTIFTCSNVVINRSGDQKAAWKAEVDADAVKRQAGADVSPKPVQFMYARPLAPRQNSAFKRPYIAHGCAPQTKGTW